MKKLIFTIGLLSTMSVTAGTVLRATLGTNASGEVNKILISGGLLGLAFVFVPSLISSAQAKGKSHLVALLVSLLLLAVGWIFKLFHITSANELVLLGTTIFMILVLPLMFIRLYKQGGV